MLVAGGSGIVPLMAMIRMRAAAGDDTKTRLLYSSGSQDDVIDRDELEWLSGNGLTVVHALTDSQPHGWTSYARRVDAPRCSPRFRLRRPSGRVSTRVDRRRSSRRWPNRSCGSDTIRGRSRPNALDPPDGDMGELMLPTPWRGAGRRFLDPGGRPGRAPGGPRPPSAARPRSQGRVVAAGVAQPPPLADDRVGLGIDLDPQRPARGYCL